MTRMLSIMTVEIRDAVEKAVENCQIRPDCSKVSVSMAARGQFFITCKPDSPEEINLPEEHYRVTVVKVRSPA